VLNCTGDDEKKKRLDKVKRNRRSTVITDVDLVDDRSPEDLNVSVPSPSIDEVVTFSPPPAASIVIIPHTSLPSPEPVVTVQPISVASSIVPSPSTISFDILTGSESSDHFAELMKSKLLSLGDLAFLPMALDATAANIFQGAASAATPADSPQELLRTLTDEEEQVLQEIVQVILYGLAY